MLARLISSHGFSTSVTAPSALGVRRAHLRRQPADLADEAGEQLHGMLATAAGRIGVGDRRWIGTAPRRVVARDCPRLGLAVPRIEYRAAIFTPERARICDCR
jgi:hypothetical protein